MSITILRNEADAVILHAVGKPAITRCVAASGKAIAAYFDARNMAKVIEGDFAFKDRKKAMALVDQPDQAKKAA